MSSCSLLVLFLSHCLIILHAYVKANMAYLCWADIKDLRYNFWSEDNIIKIGGKK